MPHPLSISCARPDESGRPNRCSEIRTELQEVTALYPIRDEVRGDLFTYIVWCDRHHRYTFPHYLSPATYEQHILPELIAA
jgi:hypothetical protein